jgi:uncharacterized protein (TIGR00156 family)
MSFSKSLPALLIAIAVCTYSTPLHVHAQAMEATRVADVLWKPVADRRVTLRGRIIRDNGAGKYMFVDSSGEMTVVISSGLLGGKEVSEYSTVLIEGRVIMDFRSTPEILVDRLQIEP